MYTSTNQLRRLGIQGYAEWACMQNNVPFDESVVFTDIVSVHNWIMRQLNPTLEVKVEEEVQSEPVPVPVDANPFPTDLQQYDSLTVAELRELCKERGLPVYGTKAEIVLRLKQNDEGIIPEEEPESPTDEVALEGESEAPTDEVAASNGEETNEENINGEQEPTTKERQSNEA